MQHSRINRFFDARPGALKGNPATLREAFPGLGLFHIILLPEGSCLWTSVSKERKPYHPFVVTRYERGQLIGIPCSGSKPLNYDYVTLPLDESDRVKWFVKPTVPHSFALILLWSIQRQRAVFSGDVNVRLSGEIVDESIRVAIRDKIKNQTPVVATA
jgi:hypothetical protein